MRKPLAGVSLFLVVASLGAATFTVTSTSDSGAGSLRQAILDANANPGSDTIVFAIPGSGVQTITAASELTITDAVLIDGYTQPGSSPNTDGLADNAMLLIELQGSGSDGLVVSAGAAEIHGLVLHGFHNAINLGAAGGSVVAGCFVGPLPSGASAPGNDVGIWSHGSGADTVGDGTLANRNLISGNGVGVQVDSVGQAVVRGNLIGTNAAGTAALANGTGVVATTTMALGGAPEQRNVVSGNSGDGVHLTGSGYFFDLPELRRRRCLGHLPLGNGGVGIYSNTNYFFSTSADIDDNTVAASGSHGIDLVSSYNTRVERNLIGLNPQLFGEPRQRRRGRPQRERGQDDDQPQHGLAQPVRALDREPAAFQLRHPLDQQLDLPERRRPRDRLLQSSGHSAGLLSGDHVRRPQRHDHDDQRLLRCPRRRVCAHNCRYRVFLQPRLLEEASSGLRRRQDEPGSLRIRYVRQSCRVFPGRAGRHHRRGRHCERWLQGRPSPAGWRRHQSIRREPAVLAEAALLDQPRERRARGRRCDHDLRRSVCRGSHRDHRRPGRRQPDRGQRRRNRRDDAGPAAGLGQRRGRHEPRRQPRHPSPGVSFRLPRRPARAHVPRRRPRARDQRRRGRGWRRQLRRRSEHAARTDGGVSPQGKARHLLRRRRRARGPSATCACPSLFADWIEQLAAGGDHGRLRRRQLLSDSLPCGATRWPCSS